jgi:hypothetical protein
LNISVYFLLHKYEFKWSSIAIVALKTHVKFIPFDHSSLDLDQATIQIVGLLFFYMVHSIIFYEDYILHSLNFYEDYILLQ